MGFDAAMETSRIFYFLYKRREGGSFSNGKCKNAIVSNGHLGNTCRARDNRRELKARNIHGTFTEDPVRHIIALVYGNSVPE